MTKPHLERTIGIWQSTSLVIGSLIGTGIFLKLAKMSIVLPSVFWLLAVWVVAGILSYTGALTYAELTTYVAKTGGEFSILFEAYGPLISFCYGWANFCIGVPGSIAAFAVGSATFLSAILPISAIPNGIPTIAICFIILFTFINWFKLKWGANFHLFITSLKVGAVVLLILGIWFLSKSTVTESNLNAIAITNSPEMVFGSWGFLKAFGLAMIAALWAYDGWNGLPMVAGEVKNPQKNIPLAIGIGLFIVMSLYLLVNYSYLHVLTLSEVQGAYSQLHPNSLPVATLAAQKFLQEWSVPILSVAFTISALGAMNGSILMGSRVPYAMATHKLLPQRLAQVDPTMHTPVWSLLIQAGMAISLAASGTFDELTEYVIVINWIFYIITTSTIFYYRKNKPIPQFKTPFFPVLPLVFIFCALLIIGNSIYDSPGHAIKGLIFILCGLPVYFYYQKKNKLNSEL
jgi:APA family basic amino acid/polyamine antiporter